MGQPNRGEREFEVGKDESWFATIKNEHDVVFANVKRTYDEYQQESLESIKVNRSYTQKVLSDAQQYDNQRQNIANQALQNAVETANMIGKQGARHADLAIDRQWNVDEQGYTAENILQQDTAQQAIQMAAVAIAKEIAKAAEGS